MTKCPTSRALALLLGVGAILFQAALPARAEPPAVDAAAAVLMDAETGTVLCGNQMHDSRPVASTTKIMTALLALENCDLDDSVIVGPAALEVTGSALYLQPGDVMQTDDLLTALLLKSANDAAVVLAEHISGSVTSFANRMNERARELGATDTHFVNPHGLHHRDHYSSAYDLALITREALKHPRFAELVATRRAKILLPSDPSGARTLRNHNKLLQRAAFVDGVKTGYVKESGHCLVASATEDGRQLIAVVLDSPDTYAESLRLLKYGLASFHRQVFAQPGDALGRAPVRDGVKPTVPAICQDALVAVTGSDLPHEPKLEVTLLGPLPAPIAQGDIVGQVRLVAGSNILAEAPLLAGEAVPRAVLRIIAVWSLRGLVILLLLLLLVRHYAKAVQARRSRRLRLPP
jgi:D-alanyl-D-alanine carboxypeptidase (penicillin-binding protein 5/6)